MASPISGNIIELLQEGDITSPWHDIPLLNADYADVDARTLPRCTFVCLSSRLTPSETSNPSFSFRRKNLSIDGVLCLDDSPPAPWHRGLLPQTCVLASHSASWVPSMPGERKQTSDAGNEGGFADVSCDSAPMEAMDISGMHREPGDVYEVIPLFALPLRQRDSSTEVLSWKILVVATDDPIVIMNRFGSASKERLPEVVEWAVKRGHASNPFSTEDDAYYVDSDGQVITTRDWESDIRTAMKQARDAHLLWKLMQGTLRKPKLSRRLNVSRRLSSSRRPPPAAAPRRKTLSAAELPPMETASHGRGYSSDVALAGHHESRSADTRSCSAPIPLFIPLDDEPLQPGCGDDFPEDNDLALASGATDRLDLASPSEVGMVVGCMGPGARFRSHSRSHSDSFLKLQPDLREKGDSVGAGGSCRKESSPARRRHRDVLSAWVTRSLSVNGSSESIGVPEFKPSRSFQLRKLGIVTSSRS